MNYNSIYCIHDNFLSTCKDCNGQYCRCCGNTKATHNEYNCPYKIQAAISSATRPRSCRALGCNDCLPGQTHYCNVCEDNDANHRALNCPLLNSNYCANISPQKHIAYVSRPQNQQPVIMITNSRPVISVRYNGDPYIQPVFVGINTNPIVGFATSNGVFSLCNK